MLNLAACSREVKKELPLNVPQRPPVATEKVAALKISFSITKQQFTKGAVVPLELVIKNTSKEMVDLRFVSAKTHDFSVKNAGGERIWQWSHGQVFAQAFQTKTLSSGESMRFTSTWNQTTDRESPVSVGTYAIEAELDAAGYGRKIGPLDIHIIN